MVDTRVDCNRKMPRGWWCTRIPGHDGPCAGLPKWWNLRAWWGCYRGRV